MRDSKAMTYFNSGQRGNSLGEQQGKLGTKLYDLSLEANSSLAGTVAL